MEAHAGNAEQFTAMTTFLYLLIAYTGSTIAAFAYSISPARVA
jgi:hypothetical protein